MAEDEFHFQITVDRITTLCGFFKQKFAGLLLSGDENRHSLFHNMAGISLLIVFSDEMSKRFLMLLC